MNKFIYGVYDKMRSLLFRNDNPNECMAFYDAECTPKNLNNITFFFVTDRLSSIDVYYKCNGNTNISIYLNKDELNLIDHCDEKTIINTLDFYDAINEVLLPHTIYKSKRISYQNDEYKHYSIIEAIKTIMYIQNINNDLNSSGCSNDLSQACNKFINQLGSNFYSLNLRNPIEEINAICDGLSFCCNNSTRFSHSNLIYNVIPIMISATNDDIFNAFKDELEESISLRIHNEYDTLQADFDRINDEVIILINKNDDNFIEDGQIPLNISVDINDRGIFVINGEDISIDKSDIDNEHIIKSIIYSLKPNIGLNKYDGERIVNTRKE